VERRAFFVLLTALPVFLLSLGANSIWDANEAFYVETPRQMVLSGDYINPTFNGEPRFNKPVLSYWIVAGLYRVLGESVGVERLGIAVGAFGILWAAFLIGRALRSTATGLLAALFLATAPRVVFFSRRIFIDVYITMFMSLALALFVLAERHPQHRRKYLLLMYATMALGILTKGPVAAALPALVCLLWLVSERRLADVRSLMLIPGTVIVAAIVAPWYLAVYAQHGAGYLRDFFVEENLGRFSTAITTQRSFAFYLPALFADLLMPWAPLLVAPMVTAWKRTAPVEDPQGAIRRLLWWWVAVIVVVFSFSASKEDLYIFPAIPAAAVLVAESLVRSEFGQKSRFVTILLALIGAVCLAVAVLIAVYFRDGFYALGSATPMALLLGLAGILALASLWRRRGQAAVLTIAAAFVLFNYLFVASALPELERLKPVPPLAETIASRGSADAALAFFNMDLPSLVYYANRSVTKVGDLESAERFFKDHAEVWMLASEPDWNALRVRVPAACVADRQPLFNAKGSDVLRRQPPPNVLLLTNKCR
jgi:4-amino-4-deoxy-L-arabinose transferase-like glycosyltransferase